MGERMGDRGTRPEVERRRAAHRRDAGCTLRIRQASAIIIACVGLVTPCFSDSTVVFNEIMYHPPEPEADLEWLELHDQMAVDMDISGWRFAEGITYEFPEGTVVPGGGYIVVASSPEKLMAATGLRGVFGPFSGRLENSGERLELRNANGRLMDSVKYADDKRWPAAADGSGSSLVKRDPDLASGPAESWTASDRVGGTPGARNFPPGEARGPGLALSEYCLPDVGPCWVEIVNDGVAPAGLAGHVLAVPGDPWREFVFPPGDLPAGGYLAVTRSDLGLQLAPGDRVFLYGPGRQAVLDGLRIEGRQGARHPRWPGRWLHPIEPTPGAENRFEFRDEVVINEVMYHARPIDDGGIPRRSPEAWIELYNRSAVPMDLTGWRLDGGIEYVFGPDTVLSPGEYLVVAADTAHLAALHPGIRIVGDFRKRLSRRGDRIVLEDLYGNPADEVRYRDRPPWPRYADGLGSSLELLEPRADNSRPEAWAASDESPKSRWRSYSYRGVAAPGVGPVLWEELVVGLLQEGEALVDDFSVVESPGGASREFLQEGGFESGGKSWRPLGNHRRSRVSADPDVPGGHVLHLVATGPTTDMHNHLETTYGKGLAVTNGRQYAISFRAKWLAGSNQLNTRLYFNRVPKTTLLDVPRTGGTPGARNSRHAGNIGPTFGDLLQEPVMPGAGEAVSVKVRISDPDGVASAVLRWRAAGGAWCSIPMVAGADGSWTAAISGHAASTVIQFYVEATDGPGATAMDPAAGPDSRALFVVEDGRGKPGKTHRMRIVMLPDDARSMYEETNLMSNEWLPCTLVHDERVAWHDAGVRIKGSGYGRSRDYRGYHLRLPSDRPFRGVHSTVHIDRSGGHLFLGGTGQDEILLKHIANHAGEIPGMYDDIIRVIAPASEDDGPTLLVMASFGDVFLDSQFEDGSEGTEFKYEVIYFPTATVDGDPESLKRPAPLQVVETDLRDLGDDKEAYRWNFLIENNKSLDDYGRLIALCKAMGSPAGKLEGATGAVMDVDQWMRTFTIISLCGVGDTYTRGHRHNAMFYVRPSDQKALAFPWDLDWTWVRPWDGPLFGDENLGRVAQLLPNRRLYYGHLLELIATTCNAGYLSRWAKHYGGLAEEDYSPCIDYIERRRGHILSSIPARVPFTITTNGGRDFTANGISTVLEGNAPFDVRSIVLGGREDPSLQPTWTSVTRWRSPVDLDFGPNDLSLFAFDRDGEVVGSDIITVTSTTGAPAPLLASVVPDRALPGETVLLRGAGFRPGAGAVFTDIESPAVTIEGPTAMRAEVPAVAPGIRRARVRNPDGRRSVSIDFTVRGIPVFLRGDADGDGKIDLGDAVLLLEYLFLGAPSPGCLAAADTDGSGTLSLTDAIFGLEYRFLGGPLPPEPFPTCGKDPKPRGLGCAGEPGCPTGSWDA
jgi:hypothetical protein